MIGTVLVGTALVIVAARVAGAVLAVLARLAAAVLRGIR